MFSAIIIFFFTTFQINTAQFPDHLDLQKIDTVEYKGQQYIVLKPATHSIVDHFQNFARKKSLNEFPTKRVFLDNNGFRHFWHHFQPPNKIDARRATVGNDSNDSIAESQKNKTGSLQKNESGAVQKNEYETVQNNQTGVVPKNETAKENEKEPVNSEKVKIEEESTNKTAVRAGDASKPIDRNRPIIRTTYYCPYVGIIYFSAFNDDL